MIIFLRADLENKLKMERKQHEHFEQVRGESKDRSVHETNAKLASLQQHYKLLRSQHEDFKDECMKLKSAHISRISSLESIMASLKDQIEKIEVSRNEDVDLWKVNFFNHHVNGRSTPVLPSFIFIFRWAFIY